MPIGKAGIKTATLVDRPKIYISLFESTYILFYDFLFNQTSKFQNFVANYWPKLMEHHGL